MRRFLNSLLCWYAMSKKVVKVQSGFGAVFLLNHLMAAFMNPATEDRVEEKVGAKKKVSSLIHRELEQAKIAALHNI